MCGIVGVIGSRPAAPLLIEALRRLEYRGYDSAGIATLVDGAHHRGAAPRASSATSPRALDRTPLAGTTGIGHTRWATHGAPTESNAHPHGTARVADRAQRHHREPRRAARRAGSSRPGVLHRDRHRDGGAAGRSAICSRAWRPIEAAGAALRRLTGAYALAMIFAGHPELIIGAQHGAPLAVGFGDDEMFVGSDALALAPLTRRIAYLRRRRLDRGRPQGRALLRHRPARR